MHTYVFKHSHYPYNILVQRANNEYDLVKYSSVKSSYKTQERRVERRVSSYHSVECFFNSCS